MEEAKVISIIGTELDENETAKLHAVRCSCGKRIIRAFTEDALQYYKNNHKYTAKCCGSQFEYVGELNFKGDKLVKTAEEKKPIVNTPKKEKVAQTTPENITSGELIEQGPRGVTNKQMIPAIHNNYNNRENLFKLFNDYEDIFMASARYIKKSAKPAVESIIMTKYPEYRIEG